MRVRVTVLAVVVVACRPEPSESGVAPTPAPMPAATPEQGLEPASDDDEADPFAAVTLRSEPKREPPVPPPDPLTLCDSSWWALTLPVPSDDGPRARLRVGSNPGHGYRNGEPQPLCVRWGDGPWAIVEPGTLAVAADPKRLQRWVIGKYPILIHVPPRDEIRYRFHPCMNWEFGGARFDPAHHEDPKARCGHRGCPSGYEPRESFDDPLCPDTLELYEMTRCTKLAVVQLVDDHTRKTRAQPIDVFELPAELNSEIIDAGGLPVERMTPGTALWQSTESCARQRAFTASDSVGLILGIGERWRIWVADDGRLTGELIGGS